MTKKPHGGQTNYSEGAAEFVCAMLGEGQTLRSICREYPDMVPPESTIRTWVIDDREGFAAQYARARDFGLDTMADELLDISDDVAGDLTDDGKWSHANVQRSRLRVDTRKWYLSKMAPKRYGEKLDVEHGGPGGGPLVVRVIKFAPDKPEEGDS